MRERLEKESTNHSQALTRAINAEMKSEDLQHKLVHEQQERVRLEKLMSEGSFPDDQKAAGLQGNKDNSKESPTAVVKAPPAPPPMAPMISPPSCPPPPPSMKLGPPGAPLMPKVELPKKNIPQSAQPLKSFNWSKLPDMKVEGTVWKELDETKWYNSMDLESIDKLFSAYQKANGVAVS
jgi:dishevelled associated activator of morphogenesis